MKTSRGGKEVTHGRGGQKDSLNNLNMKIKDAAKDACRIADRVRRSMNTRMHGYVHPTVDPPTHTYIYIYK